jgi:hypothetical protein
MFEITDDHEHSNFNDEHRVDGSRRIQMHQIGDDEAFHE